MKAAVIQTKKEKHQMENGKDSFHYLWHPPENNLLRLGKLRFKKSNDL